MTEREICISYREAKNKYSQLQVLADLNCMKRLDIVKILMRNGEKLQRRAVNLLYKRMDKLKAQILEKEKEYKINAVNCAYRQLDDLDYQISEMEKEYCEIAEAINKSKEGMKSNGNGMECNGFAE